MTTPYKVLGSGVATMLGRKGDFKKILGKLERETPEHTSVIGAKYIGKTVLLESLINHLKDNKSFDAHMYWNISENMPSRESEFFRCFAKQLYQPLETIGKEYQELISGEERFEGLMDLFEILQEEGKKVLIVIDNLDKFLQKEIISTDILGNLRDLGRLSSVWFVTGSRKRLRELAASLKIQESEFWNLFGPTPYTLGPFNDEDWDAFLEPFTQKSIFFEKGAKTELKNYTGGIPILVSSICRQMWDEFPENEHITSDRIRELIKNFVFENQDILKKIWEDCADEQGIIEDLAEGRITIASIRGSKQFQTLRNYGIVEQQNNQICQALKEFLKYENPQIKDLERLFAKEENFKKNIKKILQLRLKSLQGVDNTLMNYLRIAVENIEDADVFCTQLRNLVKRALELIWQKELPTRQIPTQWTLDWKQTDRKNGKPEYEPPGGVIPAGGRQIYLLNLMTDARKAGESRVSRTTYIMLNYIYSIGDFGQHLDDNNLVEGKNYDVPEEFAYTVCLKAIEMCELLTKDLREI